MNRMKQNEKRICFLHVGMGRGGAERVISYLANYYASNGYKVDIIVLLHDYCGYELHSNINIIPFIRKAKNRFRNIPYWIINIRNFIKKTHPFKIISFSMYVNIFTIIACVGLKKDILISERNDPSSDGRNNLDKLITKLLYPLANKVVFQTRRAKGCFSNIIQKKSRIIGNPISVSCLAQETKSNKIVSVGRLEPQKNHQMLLKAFAKVHQYYPNLQLEIYGVGSLLNTLKLQCENLGISQNVHFMGSKSNIHECIKDALAFVLPSDFEGLSNALLEAMMMGLPCISTNCAGSDEIIINKQNGLIVNIGDATEMANAIIQLIDNRELSKCIGCNAAQSMSAYKKEVILQQWCDFIDA